MTKQELKKKAEDKYNKVFQKIFKQAAFKEITYDEYREREYSAWKQKQKDYEEIDNDND